jgi:hypothetical protein
MLDATTMKVFANTQPQLHSIIWENDTIAFDGLYITLEPIHTPEGRDRIIYRLSAEVGVPSKSRMEPDDVDIKELNTSYDLPEAVRLLVMEVCWHMIDSALEADAMAAAYEDRPSDTFASARECAIDEQAQMMDDPYND